MKILVTGGAGFIGSEVVRQYLQANASIVNVDKLTYAGNLESLATVRDHPDHIFIQADICDRQSLTTIFSKHRPDAIMHLAAESHVDRSIEGPATFIQTNIVGTYILLEVARDYWESLDESRKRVFRFHHVSTDEVFGSLGTDGYFSETSPYAPNSPYSASKASADHLVRAWHNTYGLPVIVTNCSNNYGPYQYPEKLIPLTIINALGDKPLPIYGMGDNIRDWLHVEDHARALRLVLEKGRIGETYNIGGNSELTNLQVVSTICDLLDRLRPRANGQQYKKLIEFVRDRPGHDKRYAIDSRKIHEELGWMPTETFETGLAKTVEWYIANIHWWEQVISGNHKSDSNINSGSTR